MERARFRVEFIDQEALDQFRSLAKSIQLVLGKAIKDRLEVEPIGLGKPLRYSLKGHRRLRIGSYRIVYRVDADRRIVTIVAVDHRKDVYEGLD